MLWFLLGLIVGGILGITTAAILSAGALADEKMEYMLKNINKLKEGEQSSVILKL